MRSFDEDILKSNVSCDYFFEGTVPRDFHFLYRRELILSIVVFFRPKIIMYNEFGVLLVCENIGKFLAVRWVGT
jgi:hypothetical protein